MIRRLSLLLAVASAWVVTPVAAQSSGALPQGAQALLELAPAGESIVLTASSDRADGRYAVGDLVTITVTPSEDAYVYLFNVGTTGAVTLLYPNAHAPQRLLRAGEARSFPRANESWQIVADKAGSELVKIIVTQVAADFTARARFDQAGPFKVFHADEPTLLPALRSTLASESARWGSKSLPLTVVGPAAAKVPAPLTAAELLPRTGPLDRLPPLPRPPLITPSLF